MGVGVHGDIQLHRAGQAEAFDATGGRHNEAFPEKDGQVAAGAWLADALPIGARVLDVGCGTGLPTCRQLVDAGLEVTGIDASAGMLALACEAVPEATFLRSDILDPVRPDHLAGLGRFHGVTAFFSLLMLPRAEIPRALAAVRDLLVPGGWFTLGMVEADADDFETPFPGNTVRVSGYLRNDLRQVVEKAGFRVLKAESYPYLPTAYDGPPEEQLFLHCRRSA